MYSGLFLAIYLSLVLYHKNNAVFLEEILKEGDFLKWSIALILVIALSKQFKQGNIFITILFMVLIFSAYSQNDKIFSEIVDQFK